ncbi:hypothetical protein D3C79_536630 [compost metagenome]
MLQAGQFLQTQIQNRLSLLLGQVVFAVTDAKLRLQPLGAGCVVTGAFQHRTHIAQIPGLSNQPGFSFRRRRRTANQFNDRVDVCQRDGQRFQNMGAVASFTQFEDGTAGHHFTAVTDKRLQNVFQVQQFWLALMQCHHVDAESDLQLSQRIQIVQYHFADRVAFDFNHDAHAVFVGLVTQRADAFHAFFFYQLGDLLDQTRFVHLIRDFVNNNGFAAGFGVGFYFGTSAQVDFTAPGTVSLFDATATVDDRRRREVRPRDVFHQAFDADVFIIDVSQAAVDNLRQVMRRNVGGHADSDTRRAVDQQVRDLGWHDGRDLLGAIIVRHEVDGFLFQIRQQFVSNFGHAHFGITHRRGGVAVDGTEVTLTVHQHIAQ